MLSYSDFPGGRRVKFRRRFSLAKRGKSGLSTRRLRARCALTPSDNLPDFPAVQFTRPAESLGQFWGSFGPITGPQSVKEPSTRGQNPVNLLSAWGQKPDARPKAAGKSPVSVLCTDILRTLRGHFADTGRTTDGRSVYKLLTNADFSGTFYSPGRSSVNSTHSRRPEN